MNTVIGIYDDHELAVGAAQQLKDAGYPMSKLSIMGKADTEVIDEQMHLISKNPLNVAGVGAGTAIGTALGILTGVGIFAIPGVGFLYGAGALVGAIAGFDFGLIGGGIASVLATVGVKDGNAEKYKDALNDGKFILVAEGSKEELEQAKYQLEIYSEHSELAAH